MLELGIVVDGQERKLERLEEELQIGTPQGNDGGGLGTCGPVVGEACIATAQHEGECSAFGAAVGLLEFEDGAERVAPRRRKGTRDHIHLADEVDIDHTYWAAAGPLRAEVVDSWQKSFAGRPND